MDVYLPTDAKSAPVMLYVHGGGWRAGDKRGVGDKASWFTGKGWIFVSANYRLLPAGKHPANVNDLADALAWLHANVAKRGGDPEKIFLMGHSAGCHLVSLLATHPEPLGRHDLGRDVIRGVIANDTQAYDLVTLVKDSKVDTYGKVFGTDPDVLRDASPLHQVTAGAGIAPFLILYSSGMGNRPNPDRPKHAEAFRKTLEEAGVPAKVVDGSDRNHGQINQRLGQKDDRITREVEDFLKAILKPGDGS